MPDCTTERIRFHHKWPCKPWGKQESEEVFGSLSSTRRKPETPQVGYFSCTSVRICNSFDALHWFSSVQSFNSSPSHSQGNELVGTLSTGRSCKKGEGRTEWWVLHANSNWRVHIQTFRNWIPSSRRAGSPVIMYSSLLSTMNFKYPCVPFVSSCGNHGVWFYVSAGFNLCSHWKHQWLPC